MSGAAGSEIGSSRSPPPIPRRRARYDEEIDPTVGWEGRLSPDLDYQDENEHDQLGPSDDENMEELDSDGEVYSTTAAKRNRTGQGIPELLSQDLVLPEEEFGEITVRELYGLLEEDIVNLNPAYQRESVWREAKSEGLIQSIFRNIHVPELLFNVYTVETGQDGETASSARADPNRYKVGAKGKGVEKPGEGPKLVWNCADGKQRCTAIKKFLDGEIKVKFDAKTKFSYHQLDPAVRTLFDERKLRFGFYRELSYEQECELFKRVQLGVKLTSNEEVQALNSEYKLFIDELTHRYAPQDKELQSRDPEVFSPRVIDLGKRSKSLSVFFSLVSSLVVGHANAQHRTPTARLQQLSSLPLPPPRDRAMAVRILERFKKLTLVPQIPGDSRIYKWPSTAQVVGDPRNRMQFPHRVWRIPQAGQNSSRPLSPVEMSFIPLIIQKYEDRRDGDLLEIIQQLRELVSRVFPKEVMDNVRVWKVMKDFLDTYNPQTQLACIYNDDGSPVGDEPRRPRARPTAPSPSKSPSTPVADVDSPEPDPSSRHKRSKRPLADSIASSSRFVGNDNLSSTQASSTSNKRKRGEGAGRDSDAEMQRRRDEQAAEVARLEREEQARQAKAAAEEEERLKREAEARRIREEEERERARALAQKEREERIAEVKRQRIAREREIAERDRQEKEEFEARERARKEQSELERRELARVEREELERIMSEDLEAQATLKRQEARRIEEDCQEDVKPFAIPPTVSAPRSQPPSPRRSSTSQLQAPTSPSASRRPAPRTETSSTHRHPIRNIIADSSSHLNSRVNPLVDQKPALPSSLSSAPSSNSRNSAPTANDAPLPAPRIFSGIKARLAGQILSTSQPPPAPPAPVQARARRKQQPPPPPPVPAHQAQRKRTVNAAAQAQQFDARGRLIRPEVPQVDEDEIEAVGGRGEDDIILPPPFADSTAEHWNVKEEENRRMDLEVLARLSQRQATEQAYDPRDLEVQERLFAKRSQTEALSRTEDSQRRHSTERDHRDNYSRKDPREESRDKYARSASRGSSSVASKHVRDSRARSDRDRSPRGERFERDSDRRTDPDRRPNQADRRPSGSSRPHSGTAPTPRGYSNPHASLPPRPTFRASEEYSRR